MKKIIQIATGSAGTLFCLTEDGKVYQGYYKSKTVTWQEMNAPEVKAVVAPAKPVEPTDPAHANGNHKQAHQGKR